MFLLDPKTAVKLKEINGDPNSTYINANYIRVGQTLLFASIVSTPPASFSFIIISCHLVSSLALFRVIKVSH